MTIKTHTKQHVRENTCQDIDAEARAFTARGYKIMLDSRECFTASFMDAEDAGLVERDSLGFTWYPMSADEIKSRALLLSSLEEMLSTK